MRFIPKQKKVLTESVILTETEANPLDAEVSNSSSDDQYKQAILRAIGSETAADVEYSQILGLEDDVSDELKDLFHDTLVDIRNEEIKHIAQLTEKVSQIPDMKDAFEAGKKEAETGKDVSQEEVKEAVQEGRMYYVEDVKEAIGKYLWNTDQYMEMEDILKYANDDLRPEEVDNYLERVVEVFNLSPEQLKDIEETIVNSKDPAISRQEEFKSDISDDIDTLKYVFEKLYTVAAGEKLREVIKYLENLEYDGDIDTAWTYRQLENNNKKRVLL